MFGVMDIAKTLAHDGIQHIIGSQITFKAPLPLGQHFFAPMVFLAQTAEGYTNLIHLSTLSYQKPTLGMEGPHINLDDLKKHAGDVICLTGGDSGPWGQLLLKKDFDRAEAHIRSLMELFDGRLYVELMRHGTEDQAQTEPQFLEWAKDHNLPIVATNNVFYATPDMYEAQDALLCIAAQRYLSETDRPRANPHTYFKSGEEMETLFQDLPEALENTVQIAQRCSFLLKERAPILPPFESPSGLSEKDELRKQAIEGLDKRLEAHVYPHIPESERPAAHDRYFERLYKELDVIETMGFPGYFLIVSDFIKYAKSQDIPVGPGRGSGAGSLVAWALTITDIDPLRFDLIFERFLNPERVSMPDFDVDFCQDRRGEVIDYVLRKYGEDKVSQIITFGKLQARAVIKDVGRVLEIPYPQVDKVSKLIPNNPSHPVTLKEAIDSDEVLRNMINADEVLSRLVSISLKLEGLYRHASTHAAGVVIGGKVIADLVPVYYDGESPLAISQINMKYIEKAGLIKFDFLGLKTLTVIHYCCDLVHKKGIALDISTIPLDDPKTFALLEATNVLGVFQIESAGMRDVIKKMRPNRIEDLGALVALYRPGPMDNIPTYIARKHGEEEIVYPHPMLKPILEKTYGVMVYQEQVMQIAQVMAGYSLGGADILRRAMGKKNVAEMANQRKTFIAGALKNGVDEETAEHTFDLMAKFASYGFNKSHSDAYALVSYRTAYLKANFPLEFYAAVATYDKHSAERLTALFQDMKENGLVLLPPDINRSAVNFIPEGEAMRYALSSIKNVGEIPMEELVAERSKHGPFKSIEDFASRINPTLFNRRMIENLVGAGAFDSLDPNRRQMYESADAIMAYANQCKQDKAKRMRSLFGDAKTEKIPLRMAKVEEDWNVLERTQKEYDALGFFLSDHPLNVHKDLVEALHLKNSSQLEELATDTGRTVALAAIILSKDERAGRNGQKFAFLTLSDPQGVFSVAYFAENYAKIRSWIEPGMAVYAEIMARVNDDGTVRLTGLSMEKLESKSTSAALILPVTEKTDIERIKQILDDARQQTTAEEIVPRALILELTLSTGGTARITLPGLYPLTSVTKARLMRG